MPLHSCYGTPADPFYADRSSNCDYPSVPASLTWSEHQYQTADTLSPNVIPVQGRSDSPGTADLPVNSPVKAGLIHQAVVNRYDDDITMC